MVLCAVAPMAATAQTPTPVTYKVYLGTYDCTKGVWAQSPNTIGTLTITTTPGGGTYALTGRNLLPGNHLFGVTECNHATLHRDILPPGVASPDAKGQLSVTGSLGAQQMCWITSTLSAGGAVLIDSRTVQ